MALGVSGEERQGTSMVVQADRIGQLIAESIAMHTKSQEHRIYVYVGAMILVSCLWNLLAFRTLCAKLEAMNSANDGNLRGGVPDAADRETEEHFGSEELRGLRYFVHEPARSGSSVDCTRQGGSGGAMRASSKGGAPCPPRRSPPADNPVDEAARSPSHRKSRKSAKPPDSATPRWSHACAPLHAVCTYEPA